MNINAFAHRNRVILQLPGSPHMSLSEAHQLLTDLAVAIGNARGHQDVIDGKVPTPTDCPNCKARSITPRHACKRATKAKR